MVAGPGAAIDGGGVGDIGEIQASLDANADGMVLFLWGGLGRLIGLTGLLAEQGERQEYDQGADDPGEGYMGLHIFFLPSYNKTAPMSIEQK